VWGPIRDRSAGPARNRTTGLLVALRLAYAYNWFDIGPALPRIGSTFGVGPGAWGLLVAAFLVGAGASQVPAGLLARRHGERPIAIGGAALLAVAAIGGAFAPTLDGLLASRVLAGVGAGLFFSPAIGWVGRLYGPGERGVPVGGFSSAFSAGAAAGVAGAALLVPLTGWRENLVLGGVALAAVTVGTFLLTRPRPLERPPPPSPVRLSRAWRGRSVVALGIAFVGFEGATFATGQFVVPFGESIRLWPAWLAGAIGSSFVLVSVVGGPVGGWVAERFGRHRLQLAGVTLVGAAGLAALPLAGVAAAVAIGATFSFAYGFAYAVMYVLPHYWADLPAAEIPLAIGLFNAIQLGGGAGVSALFGWLVAVRSYPVAWECLAGIQVATLVSLLWLRPVRPVGRPLSGAAAPP
jgi:MFS family permease